uniref:hypothetical protein n=1 Tax=Streptomyces olivaceus TaxID=47716 RepID=UPI004056E33F
MTARAVPRRAAGVVDAVEFYGVDGDVDARLSYGCVAHAPAHRAPRPGARGPAGFRAGRSTAAVG